MKRLALSMVLVACGGHVVADDDATTDSGVDAPKDSPPQPPPPPLMDGPSPPDCKTLEAQLATARQQVKTCCPICQTVQCSHVTKDVCCPISTTATNVSAFEALVQQYIAQCNPVCPATPCPSVPSNVCIPGATNNDPGTCQ